LLIDDNAAKHPTADTANNDWRQENMANESYNQNCQRPLTHDHEVLGSVEIAEPQDDPHNHRFATISSQAIPYGNNDHYHEVKFRTDFYEDHFHEACVRTGGMIWVGDRHVHFLSGMTTVVDGHQHDFRASTMIDNPIGE
jgi:hypothetical protein